MNTPLPLTTFTCCCRVWGLGTRKPLSTCWSPWSSSSGLCGLQRLSFHTPLFCATLSPCHDEVAERGYSCWSQLVCLAVFMHVVGQNHKHMYTSLQCAYTCTPPPPTHTHTHPWPPYTEWEVDTVLTRQGSTRCAWLGGSGLAFNIFTYCTPFPTPPPSTTTIMETGTIFWGTAPLTPLPPKKDKKKKMDKAQHDIYMAVWKLYFDVVPPHPPTPNKIKKWQLKTTKHCLSLHLIFFAYFSPPPPPPPTPPLSPVTTERGKAPHETCTAGWVSRCARRWPPTRTEILQRPSSWCTLFAMRSVPWEEVMLRWVCKLCKISLFDLLL